MVLGSSKSERSSCKLKLHFNVQYDSCHLQNNGMQMAGFSLCLPISMKQLLYNAEMTSAHYRMRMVTSQTGTQRCYMLSLPLSSTATTG